MSLRSTLAILTASFWLAGGMFVSACSAPNPLYERRVGGTDLGPTSPGLGGRTAVPDALPTAPVTDVVAGNDAGPPPSGPGPEGPSQEGPIAHGDAGSTDSEAVEVAPAA